MINTANFSTPKNNSTNLYIHQLHPTLFHPSDPGPCWTVLDIAWDRTIRPIKRIQYHLTMMGQKFWMMLDQHGGFNQTGSIQYSNSKPLWAELVWHLTSPFVPRARLLLEQVSLSWEQQPSNDNNDVRLHCKQDNIFLKKETWIKLTGFSDAAPRLYCPLRILICLPTKHLGVLFRSS